MRRAALGAALLALGVPASESLGAVTLQVSVDTKVAAEVTAHVAVKNLGDEPALQLAPEAVLGDATARGEPYESLSSAFSTSWDLVLPRPSGLGVFPLVVQLRYGDVYGRRLSAPVVHEVRTPGATESPLSLSLEVTPVTKAAAATVHVQNRDEGPAAGTLHVVTSGDIAVTPADRPLEIPGGSTLHVPLEIANRSAQPGSAAALYAWVTTVDGERHRMAAASTIVTIVEPESGRGIPVVAAGLVAVLTLAAGFAVARRWLAAPRLSRSRAERRRGRR